MANQGFNLTDVGHQVVKDVQAQAIAREYAASNELRNAAMYVLRGQRDGRRYKIPHTGKGKRGQGRYYQASKPGQPPAVRTGNLRASWQIRPTIGQDGNSVRVKPGVYSPVPYNKYLDPTFGDGRTPTKVQPRPYVDRIKQRAMPKITRIYKRQYL